MNFAKHTTNRLFLAVLFSLLAVVAVESVAVGDLLVAPNRGLASTIEGGAINPADLARMQSAFERNGGKILRNAEVDGYLRFRGAEGVTDNAKQILLRSDASRSAVFEEFIHTAQHRTGRFNDAVSRFSGGEPPRRRVSGLDLKLNARMRGVNKLQVKT